MKPSSTRDRILEVAARLFREQSFDGTAISAILQNADVNSGSLYHFFPGKEALLTGVLERYIEQLEPEIIDPVEESASDPVERIFSLLSHYRLGLLVSDCTRGCPVGDLALEMGDRIPHVRLVVAEYFEQWAAAVQRWLREAGGRLPADLDRAALSRLVLSTMEGGVMQARAARDLGPFDSCVAQLRRHMDLLQAAAEGELPEVAESAVEPLEVVATGAEMPKPKRPAGPDKDEASEAEPELEWRAW